MTPQQLKIYITALRIGVDIEGMKIMNKEREIQGLAPAYDEMAFVYCSNQYNNLLKELDNER